MENLDMKKVMEGFVEFLKSLFAALAMFLGNTIPMIGTLGNLADLVGQEGETAEGE
ncbi:MAG: hypothetical protein IJJ85_02430 [Clostridia bacterium]|nr:hypothetical protein [Clostridia bacterium]